MKQNQYTRHQIWKTVKGDDEKMSPKDRKGEFHRHISQNGQLLTLHLSDSEIPILIK